jgi:steroid 5-alpha reductase family enzyme
MTDVLILLGLNLALILAAMALLWLVALRLKDVSFIDAVWPLGMLMLALATWPRADGDPLRKALLVGLCALWALRLGGHLFFRWLGHGEDRRYAALLKGQADKGFGFAPAALLFVFLPQGLFAWLNSLPVQLGQIDPAPTVGFVGWAGVALAVFGIVYEAVADAQLSSFRKDPANKGQVMDRGLWNWSRHPNYFGEACAWWGLYALAAETSTGLWSVAGPIFLTFTLTKWSGIGLTEKGMSSTRPGYADYVRRTSAFIPLPPRKA